MSNNCVWFSSVVFRLRPGWVSPCLVKFESCAAKSNYEEFVKRRWWRPKQFIFQASFTERAFMVFSRYFLACENEYNAFVLDKAIEANATDGPCSLVSLRGRKSFEKLQITPDLFFIFFNSNIFEDMSRRQRLLHKPLSHAKPADPGCLLFTGRSQFASLWHSLVCEFGLALRSPC